MKGPYVYKCAGHTGRNKISEARLKACKFRQLDRQGIVAISIYSFL